MKTHSYEPLVKRHPETAPVAKQLCLIAALQSEREGLSQRQPDLERQVAALIRSTNPEDERGLSLIASLRTRKEVIIERVRQIDEELASQVDGLRPIVREARRHFIGLVDALDKAACDALVDDIARHADVVPESGLSAAQYAFMVANSFWPTTKRGRLVQGLRGYLQDAASPVSEATNLLAGLAFFDSIRSQFPAPAA